MKNYIKNYIIEKLNDILWFDSDWVFESLEINPDE